MRAIGEVLLVAAAHFQSDTGNVVAPACQYISYNWVNALLTHTQGKAKLKTDRLQRGGLGGQKHAIMQ